MVSNSVEDMEVFIFTHIFLDVQDPYYDTFFSEKCFVPCVKPHTCQYINDIYQKPSEILNRLSG